MTIKRKIPGCKAESPKMLYQSGTQVIGFGAAGLGVAVAADKLGCLESMLHKGLIYIDKRAQNEWESLRFDIHSNSKAGDFLEGIRANGAFQSVLDSDSGLAIRAHRKQVMPLNKIADFLTSLSRSLVDKISQYDLSRFISGTKTSCLQIGDDQQITSFDANGNPLVKSRFAIASIGGFENPLMSVKNLSTQLQAVFGVSEQILRKQFDSIISDLLSRHKKVVIVGGGHSAFSVAEYLLRKFGDQLGVGQIVVLVRDKVNVYYDSIETYMCSPRICVNPKLDAYTNEVNRYCGIRGDAKHVYMQMMAGKEPRIQLHKLSDFNIASYYNQVGVCIQATGYTANKIDIVDSRGNTVEMTSCNNNYALSKTFNFVSTNGNEYKNLFGLGMGCFAHEAEHFKTTGEIPVGVNIYHALDAVNIVKNIAVLLEEEIAA